MIVSRIAKEDMKMAKFIVANQLPNCEALFVDIVGSVSSEKENPDPQNKT